MAKPKEKSGGPSGCLGSIVMLIIIFIIVVFIFSDSEDDQGSREIAENLKEQQDREKGFHCLSGWDGSHREFVRATKRMMNDPKSFDHVETRVTPRDSSGRHTIIMEFTGKNAFGGTVRSIATGSYSNVSCSVTSGPIFL